MKESERIVQVGGADEVLRLVGRELGPSGWVTVTQENVDSFGRSVDDWHWAHNNPDRAASGPFGTAIARTPT
jgi:acyl dehydratase